MWFVSDVNECVSGPCNFGGRCDDVMNGYICTCTDGYTGGNCETGADSINVFFISSKKQHP